LLICPNTVFLTKNGKKKVSLQAKLRIFAFETLLKSSTMKSLGYIGAFLGGAIAGAALGILIAPEKGSDTREKLTDAVEDFLKKHNIKLNRKDVGDLVDDIQDVTEE
jgi:hypothetical protein